jgi:glycosyltransferase involved in cell wall biosynthesis
VGSRPGERLRIAVWHNLPSGGGKRALYDHVRFLVDAGHQVEAWCPPTADRDFLPLNHIVKEHVVPLDQVTHSPIVALNEILRDRNDTVVAMDRHCERCADEIADGGFDVLFANACTQLRVTSIGRLLPELPNVLYLGEPYRWLYEAMPNPPWAANVRPEKWWIRPGALFAEARRSALMRLWSIQVREEVKNAAAFDKILCNSLYSRESILRAYGLDSRVCYLGVDTVGSNEAPFAGREGLFLTVGAVTNEKNIEFIIRALALRQDRSWPLVCVGNVVDKKVEARLRNLSAEAGIDLDIRVNVSESALTDLYKRAALFLYAPRLEPFGLAPLEAAVHGLPTVAVAEAGVRETVVDGESGVLVESDLGRFAASIDALVDAPDARERLGRQARLRVEKQWTLEQAGQRLQDNLIKAVNRANPQGRSQERAAQ